MKYITVYKCLAFEGLIPTVYGLLKRGTFASAKQYRFLRDVEGRDDIASMWVREAAAPLDAELCILFEETFDRAERGGRNWGRKARRRERIIWCNSGGVIRVDTLRIKYDDKNGSSGVEGVTLGEVTPRAKCLEVERLDREAAEQERVRSMEREAAALRQGRSVIVPGRQEICGTVLSVKWVESDWGGADKMLVERDDGAKLYGTVPSSVQVRKGDRVTLTAEVMEPKEPGFAVFKRPAKARVEAEHA